MPKITVLLAATLAASVFVSPIYAQQTPAAPQAAEPQGAAAAAPVPPDPNYVSPRIADTWGPALLDQPDITGNWNLQGGMLFDPTEAFVNDLGDLGTLTGAGPVPGTYVTTIPYNEEWQARYDRIVAQTLAGYAIDPVGSCKHYGFPRIMFGRPGGMNITQTPTAITVAISWFGESRWIYLDGRADPGQGGGLEGSMAWVHGFSVGHWEDDTLVVETTNIVPGYFDQTDPPFSDQLSTTEYIRRISPTQLEWRMVLVDPVAFTEPWEVTRIFQRQEETAYEPTFATLSDHECEALDMSMGYQSFRLPGEVDPFAEQREAARDGRLLEYLAEQEAAAGAPASR